MKQPTGGRCTRGGALSPTQLLPARGRGALGATNAEGLGSFLQQMSAAESSFREVAEELQPHLASPGRCAEGQQ